MKKTDLKRGDKVEITGGPHSGLKGEIWGKSLPGMFTIAIPGHIHYPDIFIDWLKPAKSVIE